MVVVMERQVRVPPHRRSVDFDLVVAWLIRSGGWPGSSTRARQERDRQEMTGRNARTVLDRGSCVGSLSEPIPTDTLPYHAVPIAYRSTSARHGHGLLLQRLHVHIQSASTTTSTFTSFLYFLSNPPFPYVVRDRR